MRTLPALLIFFSGICSKAFFVLGLFLFTIMPANSQEVMTAQEEMLKKYGITATAAGDTAKPASVAEQITLGTTGGILGLLFGGLIGSRVTQRSDSYNGEDGDFSGLDGFFVGGIVGFATGSILGVEAAKKGHTKREVPQKMLLEQTITENKKDKNGTFRFSETGLLSGMVIGMGILSATRDEQVILGSVLILPAAGAVFGRYIWPE